MPKGNLDLFRYLRRNSGKNHRRNFCRRGIRVGASNCNSNTEGTSRINRKYISGETTEEISEGILREIPEGYFMRNRKRIYGGIPGLLLDKILAVSGGIPDRTSLRNLEEIARRVPDGASEGIIDKPPEES